MWAPQTGEQLQVVQTSLVGAAPAQPWRVVTVASPEETTMKSLWRTDWWLGHQACTPQVPSHRAHPQVSTPIIGIAEEAYLRWLIGGEP